MQQDFDSSEPIPAQFPSMAAAAAGLYLDPADVRAAKKSGKCPAAFTASGRVISRPLLKYFHGIEGDELPTGPSLERLNSLRADREAIRLAKDREKILEKDDWKFAVSRGMAIFASLMDRKFKVEAPPMLKGRSETEIAAWLDDATQEFYSALSGELEKERKNGE